MNTSFETYLSQIFGYARVGWSLAFYSVSFSIRKASMLPYRVSMYSIGELFPPRGIGRGAYRYLYSRVVSPLITDTFRMPPSLVET